MLRVLLVLILTAACAAPRAQAQTAFPFTIRVEQAGSVLEIADGATVFLASDGVGLAATATLTITYRGTDQAQITQIARTGSLDFSISAPELPVLLSSGGSFTIPVEYLPAGGAARSAQLVFTYVERTRTATFRVNLSGTAPEFAFVFTPPGGNATQVQPGARLAFPDTPLEGAALASFSVVNRGSGAGRISGISVTGEAFELRGAPLVPAQVDAGRELRFNVAFTPKRTAAASGVLSLELPGGRAQFMLEGLGVSPAFAYQILRDGELRTVLPNQTISLGEPPVGETASVAVRVSNIGNADGVITQIAVSGEGYRLTNLPFLPARLAPGAMLEFTLTFVPSKVGSAPGRLKIGADEFPLTASGAGALLEYQARLAGTLVRVGAGGTVVFTPASVGTVVSASFEVTNTGTREATLRAISLARGDAFSLADLPAFPVALPPGATLGFTVRFAPKTAGSLTDTLRIDDVAITLSGAGTPPPPLPAYRFEGPSGVQAPRTQPAVGIRLEAPYPLPITGTLALTFASDVFAADPAVQFATGGRTVEFTIPANSTRAVFPNNATEIRLQTGTVAGVITLTPSFAAEGGFNLTPSSPRTHVMVVERGAPQVLNVTLSQTSPSALSVVVTGFCTARSVREINLSFTPVAGESLATTTLAINAETAFDAWYASTPSVAFGSQFSVTIPLQLSGQTRSVTSLVNAIQSIAVSLRNALGASNTVTVTPAR
jgi:hypothetical protein